MSSNTKNQNHELGSISNKQPLEERGDTIQQTEQEFLSDKAREQPNTFNLTSKTFQMGFSWLSRYFYLNYSFLLVLLRGNVISKDKVLQLDNLPSLDKPLRVQTTLDLYESFLQGMGKEEGCTASDITNMIKKTFKMDYIAIHTLCVLEICCKIFNSVLIQQIISTFQDEYSEGSTTYKMSIIYTLILFILIFFAMIFRNRYQYLIELDSTQARQGLITLLYKKAGTMTQYQISKANVGKIFNMISADLVNIEILMPYIFQALWTPLLIIATTIIICLRLGPYGLISIGFILIIYPSQQILGKLQYKHFAEKARRSDDRIKIINESIEGIRLIKMYGWENAIGESIDQIRVKEQRSIFNIVLNRAADRAFSNALILIAAFLPFLAIHYSGDDGSVNLTSAKIFATLEQINGLKFMLILSGVGVGFLYQWKEISTRFASFVGIKNQYTKKIMKNPKYSEQVSQKQSEIEAKKAKNEQLTVEEQELLTINPFVEITNQTTSNTNKYPQTLSNSNAIEFSEDFECFWERNEKKQDPCVKFGKPFNFEKGKFYGIVGKIGSGKSSLFQILIQEMPFYQGEIRVSGSIAFVEQEPYIFSGKVVDNILFGKPMNQKFYKQVIEACCLKDDIASFSEGDQTEIGERGITLSGGQKARLSLARAVYSDSDIILLDDPLSAVDAKVAKSIHSLCLLGLLKGKTVILVTHQVHFTKECDEVLIFEEGRLANQGKFEQLKERIYSIEKQPENNDNQENKANKNNEVNDNQDHVDCIQIDEKLEEVKLDEETNEAKKQQEEKGKGLFSSDEDEQVKVTGATIFKYLNQSNGVLVAIFALVMFAASEVLFTFFYRVMGNYDSESDKDTLFKTAGIILIFYTLTTYLKYFSIAAVTYVSNKEIHRKMFNHLSRAPVTYFEQNPSGRIVNKFSSDISTMDFVLFFHLIDCTENPITFLNLMITVGVYNYYFFILAGFYALFLLYWLMYSKELIVQSKSLDTIYKGPVMSHFSKTIQGISNLRIYGQINTFLKTFFKLSDDSIRTNHWYYQGGRAFSFNGQIISCLVTFFGIMIAIYTSSNSDSLGQTIVYLSIIIELNNFLIRQMIQLEGSLTSVERVFKIIEIKPEGPLRLKSDENLVQNNSKQKTPTNQVLNHIQWVQKGELEFKNVFMKYREELDYTLKGVNFKIQSGEHVGCIGRTGAGKSSLLQVLFRMVEIERSAFQSSKNGQILLDGVDISEVGLNTLRANISIIPQSSFVFSGTIRKNLDPLGLYEESKIVEALKLTGLYDVVFELDKKLDTDMTNASSVFSVGQKQLICLARAILSQSKLVVLDEATANLDLATDKLIQATIKNQFQKSTIFTIAHRLNTIADYDKILVMSDGKVAEFDSPFKLLANDIHDTQITSNSLFAQMVKHTGKSNSETIFEIAKQKYLSSSTKHYIQ